MLESLFLVLFFYLCIQFFYTGTGYKETLQQLLQQIMDRIMLLYRHIR